MIKPLNVLHGLFLMLLTATAFAQQQPTVMELATDHSLLRIDAKGQLQLESKNGLWPRPAAPQGTLWRVVLQTPSTPSKPGLTRNPALSRQLLRAEKINDGWRLSCDQLTDGQQTWRVTLSVDVVSTGNAFQISARVINREPGWIVRELQLPVLEGLQTTEGIALYWPRGMGQRFEDFSTQSDFVADYPGNASMQWFALGTPGGGIYFASHDETLTRTRLETHFDRTRQFFSASFTKWPFCAAGKDWVSKPILLQPYRGDWHTAARLYRQWTNTWLKPIATPQWLAERSGWLLTVLKQQNGDVMWQYSDLDKLATFARRNGLDMLGLFGWAEGGHDYQYPDYIPDRAMGGAETLRQNIKRLRAQNMPAIIYANGQLIDSSTAFYRQNGNDAICWQENSNPYVSAIRKFFSATPVTFVQADPRSEVWYQRMLALAKQAQQLGAGGILYDQLGLISPNLCFAPNRPDASPADAYGAGRARLLKRIKDEMQKIDPEFAVLTEGITDALSSSIQYVHGSGNAFQPEANGFPELFRYTFPEIIVTQRHSTPMMDRATANFAAIYGMRHEVEIRYRPDVAYALNGALPNATAYDDVAYYPPNAAMMRATAPEEAARYLRELIAFEQQHAEFLRHGKFMDEDGIVISGNGFRAKVFQSGNRLGMLLWNTTDKAGKHAAQIAGYHFVRASEPGKKTVDANSPIPPQGLRLEVWEK